MLTWFQIKDHLSCTYEISTDQGSFVKLVVPVDDRRSQVVFVNEQLATDGQGEWLHIESPFARVYAVDLPAVLAEVGNLVCGGLSLMGDYLTIRHSLPLATLELREFEQPLALVSTAADRLEQQFVGADIF
jgi:hypothetical protein